MTLSRYADIHFSTEELKEMRMIFSVARYRFNEVKAEHCDGIVNAQYLTNKIKTIDNLQEKIEKTFAKEKNKSYFKNKFHNILLALKIAVRI